MGAAYHEIRICQNCGLRYPLCKGQDFGVRCPACLGETSVVLNQVSAREVASDGTKLPDTIQLHGLLDNIRSGWNVGSILRTADGFGFKHIYMCGITPTPEQQTVKKTALGAEKFVTWSAHQNAVSQSHALRAQGWEILALENGSDSIPIHTALSFLSQDKIVLVLGNEVCGVDPELLKLADKIIHLPMQGQKRSYNVAVAFAAASAIIYNALADLSGGNHMDSN